MLFYLIFFIFSEIIFSKPLCKEGINHCSKCNPMTKLCVKCEKDIYSPDRDGGCENSKKCIFTNNYCFECSEDGSLCKVCDVGYFPDENGGCSITDNCEISYKGECLKCKDNYLLIGKTNDTSLNDKIKLCKPYSSDDLQNCKSINLDNGKCEICEDGYFYSTTDQKCSNVKNCSLSSFGICKKCDYGYYLNKKEQKCIEQNDKFLNCKISNEGQNCDECNDDYFFDKEGKCVYSNYCSQGDSYICDKCIDGYYLTQYERICTTEENCFRGIKDIGICTLCKDNYFIDFKDGKCKSNQEDNDLKNCRVADEKCIECQFGFYLSQLDQKCCNSKNCLKSENGICTECINSFHLGLDKKCTDVEHCIYTDEYFRCIECEDNYYYDKVDQNCKIAEGKFKNCLYGFKDDYCAICKDNFYISQKDFLCYSNQDKNDFYNCKMSSTDGTHCILCIDNYFAAHIDHKCTKAEYCSIIENDERCLECDDSYCLDVKDGRCENNDLINDLEKIFYFRCNRTNIDSTSCEVCLEGYDLKDGLCIDNFHCSERNQDGTCKKCKKYEDEVHEQCLNNIFGCIDSYYNGNCLECNDLLEIGDCTKCIDGFELDRNKRCYKIDE